MQRLQPCETRSRSFLPREKWGRHTLRLPMECPSKISLSLSPQLADWRIFRAAEGIIDIPVGEGKIEDRFRMTLRLRVKIVFGRLFMASQARLQP